MRPARSPPQGQPSLRMPRIDSIRKGPTGVPPPVSPTPGMIEPMAVPLDALFQKALSLFDAGDVAGLERLIAAEPRLVRERLEQPGPWLRETLKGALDSFFAKPYLLWFVSEDAPRAGRLPPTAVAAPRVILDAIRREAPETLQ